MKVSYFTILYFIAQIHCFSQKQADSISIYKTRKTELITSGTLLYGTSVIGMYELWYKPYKKSSFHWTDDSKEWLQLDKAGHSYSAYYLDKAISNGFFWSGTDHKHSILFGSGVALIGVSTVEVFDGFCSGWGASASDLVANFSGVLLYSSQQLAWGEEKIIPKFSYHNTLYSSMRPEIFGKSFTNRLLKDYNGQTYWLSFNVSSFFNIEHLPKWLCFSLGYGGEGMASGREFEPGVAYYKRYRQYYLSLDLDFKKIKTSSGFLKVLFNGLNMVKIPFPTIEFSENRVKGRLFYF